MWQHRVRAPPPGMGTSLALAAVSWLPPLLVVLLLLCL